MRKVVRARTTFFMSSVVPYNLHIFFVISQ
jgi:hypothetical protein